VIGIELLNVIRCPAHREPFRSGKYRGAPVRRQTLPQVSAQQQRRATVRGSNRASKLHHYTYELPHLRRLEAGKPRRQKRMIKHSHVDLVALGYGRPAILRGAL